MFLIGDLKNPCHIVLSYEKGNSILKNYLKWLLKNLKKKK